MANFKNIKTHNKSMIKKISLIFTLLFLSLMSSSVYGQVLYEDNQNITQSNFNEASVIGSSNPGLLFNGGADITENFQLSTTPLYLLLSAGGVNPTETLQIAYYDSILEQFVTNDYEVTKEGNLIIELTPQDIGDKTSLLLLNASGNIFYSYVFIHDELRGETTTVFEPLISGVVDLIKINITLWKAGFYLIIFLVATGLIIGLFAGAFWIIRKTKEIGEGEGFVSNQMRK